ncbi:MAG: hypothetical protein HY747_02670, partial [Elusimicrobia bacterium]|nr:hypothetical protein [Elusimicrobiota bacterium]
MMRINRARFGLTRLAFLFVSSFSFLVIFAGSAFSHTLSEAPYSHIDVFYDTSHVSSPYDVYCDSTPGGGDLHFDFTYPSSGATAGAYISTMPAIEFNNFSGGTDRDPKTNVLIVVRHKKWVGFTHADIQEAAISIKRLTLTPGTPPKLEESAPLRTFSFPNMEGAGASMSNICAVWDGSFFVDEKGFGKMNGTYSIEAQIKFSSGDNKLEPKFYYPGENQQPILVDVMDIHSVVSSPTVSGMPSGLPIITNYKLSKSGNVTIDIFKGTDEGCSLNITQSVGNSTTTPHPVPMCQPLWAGGSLVRRLVDNQPRFGEDTTQGAISVREVWDGRDQWGNLVSSGTYVFQIFAWDPDLPAGQEGTGTHSHDSDRASFAIALDPLQISNLSIQGISTQSTGYAGINVSLTEAASVYFSIWQTSAAFDENAAPPSLAGDCASPSYWPDACPTNRVLRIRQYVNTISAREPLSMIWDGRDSSGNPVDDGNYVVTVWAAENENSPITSTSVVKTARPRIGIMPVTRGLVPLQQVTAQSFNLSSPPISGLAPFYFSYSLGRDARVNLKVKALVNQSVGSLIAFDPNTGNVASPAVSTNYKTCPSTAGCTIAHLVKDEIRPGSIMLIEPVNGWDGRTTGLASQNGIRVSSGEYMLELEARDTLFPNRVSKMTSYFSANMLRTYGVKLGSLLSGSTDSVNIGYAISEPMDVRLEIYSPTATFSGAWPNLALQGGQLIKTIYGARPGRTGITEFWDGRDDNGYFVDDGNYILVLKSFDIYGNYSPDTVIKEMVVARGQIQLLNPDVTPTYPTIENSSETLNIPLEPYEISYTLSRDALVTIEIKDAETLTLIKRLLNKEPRAGMAENKEFWDGTNFAEIRLSTGNFVIDLSAEDQSSVNASSSIARIPLSIDLLRVYDIAVTPLTPEAEAAEISYQISEPLNVDLRIYKPGTIFNAAGQPIPAESESLVFYIRGPRPSRVPLTEYWEGVNLFQKRVPDGNYAFRLIATDERGNKISNVESGQLPVLRLGSADPQATFDDQTFAYPNPVIKSPLKICSFVPVDADVNLRIYTLSGELVWEKNLGRVLGGQGPCNGLPAIEWNLQNNWGRAVA